MPPGAVDAGFERLLAEAEARPVSGWDFSWLGSRRVTSPLPWDYESALLRHARGSPDLLDLGTGGGERLAALSHRPPHTVATESWEPNVDVARARLGPLGVTVVRVEAAPDNVEQERDEKRGRLPFPSESFHLVACRHEAFVATEVARVLVAGGHFVTQQVGGNYDDFYRLLGLPLPARPAREWNLASAIAQIERAGLRVVGSSEGEQTTTFADVGALAWYLKAVPWTVPGFSAREHRPRLADLHCRIARDGPVTVHLPAFYLEAIKPTPDPKEPHAGSDAGSNRERPHPQE
jgi:SAM-dependent methyltransferase